MAGGALPGAGMRGERENSGAGPEASSRPGETTGPAAIASAGTYPWLGFLRPATLSEGPERQSAHDPGSPEWDAVASGCHSAPALGQHALDAGRDRDTCGQQKRMTATSLVSDATSRNQEIADMPGRFTIKLYGTCRRRQPRQG